MYQPTTTDEIMSGIITTIPSKLRDDIIIYYLQLSTTIIITIKTTKYMNSVYRQMEWTSEKCSLHMNSRAYSNLMC